MYNLIARSTSIDRSMWKRLNNRTKLSLAFSVVAVIITTALIALYLASTPQAPPFVAETRDLLRSEGFKTDLADFNFSTDPETRARVAPLTNNLRRLTSRLDPAQLVTISSNSAILAWPQQDWPSNTESVLYYSSAPREQSQSEPEFWPALRTYFESNETWFNAARTAALTGPIRFHLDAKQGHALLLPHLAAIKEFARLVGVATILELHDGNKDAAWTNLLAATLLVTTFSPEPTEVSALVRFASARIAFNTVWQALPAGWPEERLAKLQQEWEAADFFSGLPETAAYARASAVATCQAVRKESVSFRVSLSQAIRSPGSVWSEILEYRRQLAYRRYGSYEDERDLLLHYRDREIELRRALQAPSWMEMRQKPGVTNFVPFQSRHSSSVQAVLNLKQIGVATQLYIASGQTPGGGGILGRAADAESHRRLIVTAIALERYRARNGAYPETLAKLSPHFLSAPLTDFMDGQPLRYRLEGGEYRLYSVGLDGVDNGGVLRPGDIQIARENSRFSRFQAAETPVVAGSTPGTDLLWPRVASQREVANFRREQWIALRDRISRQLETEAELHFRATAECQANVDAILSTQSSRSPRLKLNGRDLTEILRNVNSPGTKTLSLAELLTPRQVVTGDEPELVTFEVPVNYDSLTNVGSLELMLDPIDRRDLFESVATAYECRRSTNGNSLMIWNTIYESPGQHALQLALVPHDPDLIHGSKEDDGEFILGPFATFMVTNLCQFSPSSSHVDPILGATLHAQSAEPSATCTVDITTPDGKHLATFTGSTSNSLIVLRWDLQTKVNQRWTNDLSSVCRITLPASGRSQTIKGPWHPLVRSE